MAIDARRFVDIVDDIAREAISVAVEADRIHFNALNLFSCLYFVNVEFGEQEKNCQLNKSSCSCLPFCSRTNDPC